MPEDLEGVEKVPNEEPSRRTFLKVSAVAGASVAAIAAGAGVIPKLASSGAIKAASADKAETRGDAPIAVSSSSDPLILVLRTGAIDVYRGESKIAIQDSSLARELTARVTAKLAN
jgi:hypothetical protein